MKTLITSILFLLIFPGANTLSAQIQNTSWKGVFNIPSPAECIFEFKTDTVFLTSNGDLLETSIFKINEDTLTLQKLSGVSPCDLDVIGIYQFKIQDEKLILTIVDDACDPRAMAIPQEPMTAVKNEN